MSFVHLQTHSEYSMLQSSLRIKQMISKALADNQPGIAITDHGCMFGTLEFYFTAQKMAKEAGKEFNPIIGCHIYVEHPLGAPSKAQPYDRLVLLCETQQGYQNLMKIVSWPYEGGPDRYSDPPLIPFAILQQFSTGLIALYGGRNTCAYAYITNQKDEAAQQCMQAYEDIFTPTENPRFYLSLQDQGIKEQQHYNQKILAYSEAKSIPLVATNDVHYLNREDQHAHKILRCISTQQKLVDSTDAEFPTDQFYFRTSAEMQELFSHYPQAVQNTVQIAQRCHVSIKFIEDDTYWPKYEMPPEFANSDDYLAHITWSNLKSRYPDPTPEVTERVQYELDMMKSMKVAGYMLIVQDFINWARETGIPVGPGRGSAVGSIVSYIIGITDVDPLRFKLLFERFLNPERVSMPDIDTDFSDLDRSKVIDYVTHKYGAECVSQIVTYGRLKAKAVFRDVGRVLDFPYEEVNRMSKEIPAMSKNLDAAWQENEQLKILIESNEKNLELWRYAKALEGLVRQAGIHAAAVIIAPTSLSNLAPLYRAERTGNNVIQFDKNYAEGIGLLKMDFLGLRNLSVIQETLRMIKDNHNVNLDPRVVPLHDPKTYELLGKGLTTGVFQFESGGMQNYLRQLRPSTIEDMIAMNALYRPGPIENIPTYIQRKNDPNAQVDCYHEDLESILGETYGVIVYQEQVMLLAQKLSGFSLGGADLLRRAMAKKKESEMNKLFPQFVDGAVQRGYAKELPEKIWKVLGPFCAYAFNKSHSAAYAYIGFQTAYLKAHYGPEFMASNMTSEIDSTDRLVILMDECRKMNIEILHPDVNSSMATFTAVDGKISYGLAGIKNVGLSIIEDLVLERKLEGSFDSLFELCDRVLKRQNVLMQESLARTGKESRRSPLNKKVLESLIMAGALDHLPQSANRASLYASVDKALEYATRSQNDRNSGQTSLFDLPENSMEVSKEPDLEQVEPWAHSEMLEKEKKVLGLYLSSDPLAEFKMELKGFTTISLHPDSLEQPPLDEEVTLGGRVVEFKTFPSKQDPNQVLGTLALEDIDRNRFSFFLRPQILEDVRDKVTSDSMILAKGKFVERRNKWAKEGDGEKPKISFELFEIMPIEDARSRWSKYIHLQLDGETVAENTLREIQDSAETFMLEPEDIQSYPYSVCTLVFHYRTPENAIHIVLSPAYKVTCEADFIAELQDILGEDAVWFSDRV
jgi:DNA polymerase III subunit alpha